MINLSARTSAAPANQHQQRLPKQNPRFAPTSRASPHCVCVPTPPPPLHPRCHAPTRTPSRPIERCTPPPATPGAPSLWVASAAPAPPHLALTMSSSLASSSYRRRILDSKGGLPRALSCRLPSAPAPGSLHTPGLAPPPEFWLFWLHHLVVVVVLIWLSLSAHGVESSIISVLTMHHWETLNHMAYKFGKLDKGHGKLALKILGSIVQQSGLGESLMFTAWLLISSSKLKSFTSNVSIEASCRGGFSCSAIFSSFSEPSRASTHTCNAVLNALVEVGESKHVWFFLKESLAGSSANLMLQKMKSRSISSVVTYNTILYWYVKKGRFKAAMRVLEDMEKNGVEADAYTYNIMIDKMRGKNLSPDECTYNTLIKGFLDEGKIKLAIYIFNEMMKQSLKPSLATYTTLIDGYCRSGVTGEALRVLYEMQVAVFHAGHALNLIEDLKASGTTINRTMYTILIDGFCQLGVVSKAKQILKSMLVVGVNPDVVTYSALINGMCKMGKLDETKEILSRMQKQDLLLLQGWICQRSTKVFCGHLSEGLDANSFIHNTLLCKLYREGMVTQAEQFKQYMSRMKISFDVASFNCIIDFYCERYGCSPNVDTYRNLLRGLCKGGHLVQAKEFMACLVDIPSAIDQETFNALLLGICKDGTLDEALDLCEKMVTSNFLPDIHTYTVLLSGFCRKGKIVPAVILLQMMLEKGFVPDIVTYTCLLNGLIKEGQIICKEGMYADCIAYNSMMSRYLKAGMIHKVDMMIRDMHHNEVYQTQPKGHLSRSVYLYKDMVRKGIRPNNVTYRLLIHGFSKHGITEIAIKFLDKMVLERIYPDRLTFDVLITVCSEKSRMSNALQLFNCMKRLYMLRDINGAFRLKEEMAALGVVPAEVAESSIVRGKEQFFMGMVYERALKTSNCCLYEPLNEKLKKRITACFYVSDLTTSRPHSAHV
ncbi:hypothetical protein ZWY2020_053314 [Hordeum vulgare]|nr:hypothetical protein ZWY2020_053314 [Hordeum vulgare]